MTFKEIQDDALERLEYNPSGTGSPRNRIKRMINQHMRTLLADPKFSKLRDGHTPFTTVASTPLVGIPLGLSRIDRIYDPTNNNIRLFKRSLDWLRQDSRADVNTGTPRCYVEHGLKPIYRYPAIAGSGLWAVSTAAGDTTQTVTLQGFRVDGYQFNPSAVTLTGTTRVAIGTRTDYVDIMKLRLSAVCAGDIQLWDAAVSGNQLATIPIGKRTQIFTLLQLYPVPNAAYTYMVEGQREIQDMDDDIDEPTFWRDFHHYLVLKTIEVELREVKKQIAQADAIFKREVEPLESKMLLYPLGGDDSVMVPDDGRTRVAMQGSNLGSWFPNGRW